MPWEPLPVDNHRITVIGNTVMKTVNKVIGVGVDDIKEKIDWYKAQIASRFPKISIIGEFKPTPGVHMIQITRKQEGMG